MDSERQVTVRGTPAAIEAWLQMLDGPIAEGWSAGRYRTESKGKRNGRWPICLVWSGNGVHPRTAVFLQPVSDAEVGVMSIVGLTAGSWPPRIVLRLWKPSGRPSLPLGATSFS